MTIIEAISLLKQYIDYNNTDIPDFYTMAEACEVVIKALEQQPMDIVTDMDCVSRQLVLKQTYNWSKDEFLRVTNPFDYLRKRINSLPSVTPQPKMGKWVKTIGENGVTSAIRCSKCGFEDNRYELFDYCPVCGLKMQEVQNDKRRSN